MALAPFDALKTKLQAVVDKQLALNWTPPAMAKSLKASLGSLGELGATIELADPKGNGTPPKVGRPTDPLSLGVGVSVGAAASISAGISLGIGLSATASLLAQLTTGLHKAVSGTNDLERELAAYNAQAVLVAGNRGVMPPGRHVEQGGVNRSLRSLNDRLSDCQSKASSAAAARPISPIEAELRQPRMGAWHCSLDVDSESIQKGKINFKLDELEFTGTVVPDHSGVDGSRAKCKVIAGNGNVNNQIEAKSYSHTSGVTIGTVVRDILKECGEDLSDLADKDALNRRLSRWHRASGKASTALTLLAEKHGLAWRMMRDGTVWFGEERWPEVAPEGTQTGGDWSDGVVTLASETPNMVPGTVYQGQKIEDVTHRYGSTLRTEIRTSSPGSALSGAFKRRQHEVDYSREYPCKVVTQNPDGTLQLLPDDDIMKGSGFDHVPIRYGLPGFRAKVKNGARCHLAFAAGDPARPFVGLWEFDPDTVTEAEFAVNGRSAPIARQGDPVTLYLVAATPTPITGVIMPGPVNFTGTMALTGQFAGVVGGGNPSLKG